MFRTSLYCGFAIVCTFFATMTLTTFSLFIGGLAAAAIPVLLHLLMRGKPKRIEFPALMFLKKKLSIQRRTYQLKHWILLVLRILLFVLCGLALSRPILKMADWFPSLAIQTSANERSFASQLSLSLGSQDAPVAAAIVIDSSLRMGYVAENQTRLDLAKKYARWILNHLPQNSSIAIISSEHEIPTYQVDPLAAEEKIERLQLTPISKSIANSALDALNLLQKTPLEQRELYILTDLAQSSWPTDVAASLQKVVQNMQKSDDFFTSSISELGIFVVDVGVMKPVNSAIDAISMIPKVAASDTPVRIDVQMSHLGPTEKKIVEVVLIEKLGNSEQEQLYASKTIDFPEGDSRRQLSFSLSGFDAKPHQGKIRFRASDALVEDDEAWFTISVQNPWRLLICAPQPIRETTIYLKQALETIPIDVEICSFAELSEKTLSEMQQFRGIFLLDPTPLSSSIWKKLADYAALGFGVGVFLGPNVGGADGLLSFNDPAARSVLGVNLVRHAIDSDGETWMVPKNESSPILSPFKEAAIETIPWSENPIFRYWETANASPQSEVEFVFSDGRAAILTQRIGRGKTVTVTTPISELPETPRRWNILTRGDAAWIFILLAEGIAKEMIGVADQSFNFVTGEPIVLRPNVEPFPETCLLGSPSGRSTRLAPDVTKREIIIPAQIERGNYQVRSGGTRGILDIGFSINLRKGITNLQRIEPSELDIFFGKGKYRIAKTPQEVEFGIARRRIGQEMFTLIIIFVALIFVAEGIFSNRFYGKSTSNNL
ncbi:MAG: BatA domain-containing protein, partial [Thermoguttaceae bacterium]